MKVRNCRSLMICSLILNSSIIAFAEPGELKDASWSVQSDSIDLSDRDMTTVNFVRGGTALSEAELRNIRAVYKHVSVDTDVSRIVIAAWADREGLKADEKVLIGQIRLAQKRSDVIRKVLREMSDRPAESYNLAENPNALEKAFPATNSRAKDSVKGNVERSGRDAVTKDLAYVLESKGGAGKALIIIEHRDVATTTSGR